MSSLSAQNIAFRDLSSDAGIVADGRSFGVAVADYDRDGWDDAYVTVLDGTCALFRNRGDGAFVDRAEEAGVDVEGEYNVPLWGDVNNDGFADLFVGQRRNGQSFLFLNQGDGTFADVTATSGIDRAASVRSATFGDFDGDGRIDLFLATAQALDILYQNVSGESQVRFIDISAEARIGGIVGSFPMQATWVDYDNDGDLDLFAVHDGLTVESRLYRNDNRLPFVEVARAANIASVGAGNSMGVAWGDFDNDGWQDAYVTRIGTGGFYRNHDGTFTDIAVESGAARNGMGWGVVFVDFDHDGDQDLFLVNTFGFDSTPSLLYENEGGHYREIGAQAGAALRISGYGLAAADFNRDGYTDLFIASHDGHNRLLVNDSGGGGNWLQVTLRGSTVNRMAIGAKVEVSAGGSTQIRVVSGGDSYCSRSSSTLHFGLGSATEIDVLKVYWGGDLVEERHGLEVNRSHLVVQDSALSTAPQFLRGDCDGDGQVTGTGDAIFFLLFNFTGGEAPGCLASCDVNGDGDVLGTVTDALYLLGYSFLGGPAPPEPFPGCGPGTIQDRGLGCETLSPLCN